MGCSICFAELYPNSCQCVRIAHAHVWLLKQTAEL